MNFKTFLLTTFQYLPLTTQGSSSARVVGGEGRVDVLKWNTVSTSRKNINGLSETRITHNGEIISSEPLLFSRGLDRALSKQLYFYIKLHYQYAAAFKFQVQKLSWYVNARNPL